MEKYFQSYVRHAVAALAAILVAKGLVPADVAQGIVQPLTDFVVALGVGAIGAAISYAMGRFNND